MEENSIAFTRAGDGLAGLPGPAARAIDRFAIFPEPITHLLQPAHLARLDPAIRHRADVEEQVAVAARATDQRLQAFLEGFHLVIRLPCPLLADRRSEERHV